MNPPSPRVRQTPCFFRLFPRYCVGLAICLGLFTAGCGNRGPLYLPDAEETTATAMDDSRDTPAGPFDIPPDDGVAGADGSTDEEQDDEKDANASPDG